MNFELLHPADQLIMIMERIYAYGMTTTSGGNLSIMDENGDIWITPGGIDKGTLTRRDIIRVKPDGTIIGDHKPSSEFPFHQLAYTSRPDFKAVLHAHPPALVAFSIVRRIPDINLVPNIQNVCGKVGMAEYGLPGSKELAEKIALQFKSGFDIVILENHGIVVGANNLFDAFKSFETLDFCARLEIDARTIGIPIPLSKEGIGLSNNKHDISMEEFIPKSFTSLERQARRVMCELIHRAYDQKLFTSTEGTFSRRLKGDSFLITPFNVDRNYIQPEDIVRIDNGQKEAGKSPSRSVMLHKAIYEKHPHINSVIIAHAPNIMAFAVTDVDFDSRTIPESYILLRNIPKVPYGTVFMETKKLAERFVPSVPIILVKNDCIIATGDSLINTFDRLEVAEYSAKAIIACKHIGAIVAIDDEKIAALEVAFNLEK